MRQNRTIVGNVMAMCLVIAIEPRAVRIGVAFADEPRKNQQAPVDRSRVLIRREAEAALRRREADFERLRKLPPGPAGPDELVVRVRRAPAGLVIGRVGGVLVRLEAEPEPAEDDDVGDELAHQNDGPRRRQRRAIIPSRYFDRLIFGDITEQSTRSALLHALEHRLRYLKQTYALTPAQEQKLLLAGKGDLKRLFDEIADERQSFEQARSSESRLRDFLRDIAPLRLRIGADVFDGQSLFTKTLQKMRAEKQLVRKVSSSGP
jgi:hypothetical protein